MTQIKKLEHAYNNQDTCYSWPSNIDIINKINEIIDFIQPVELPTTDTGNGKDWVDSLYLERHGNTKDLNTSQSIAFRQAIEKHMPKPVDPVWLDEIVTDIIKMMLSNEDTWKLKEEISKYLAPYITGKQEQLVPLDLLKIRSKFDELEKKWEFTVMSACGIIDKYWVHTQEETEISDKSGKVEVSSEKVDSKKCRSCWDSFELKLKHKCRCYDIADWFNTTPLNPAVTSTIEEQVEIISTIYYWTDKNTEDWRYKADNAVKKLLSSLSPIGKKYTMLEIQKILIETSNSSMGIAVVANFLRHIWLLQE